MHTNSDEKVFYMKNHLLEKDGVPRGLLVAEGEEAAPGGGGAGGQGGHRDAHHPEHVPRPRGRQGATCERAAVDPRGGVGRHLCGGLGMGGFFSDPAQCGGAWVRWHTEVYKGGQLVTGGGVPAGEAGQMRLPGACGVSGSGGVRRPVGKSAGCRGKSAPFALLSSPLLSSTNMFVGQSLHRLHHHVQKHFPLH